MFQKYAVYAVSSSDIWRILTVCNQSGQDLNVPEPKLFLKYSNARKVCMTGDTFWILSDDGHIDYIATDGHSMEDSIMKRLEISGTVETIQSSSTRLFILTTEQQLYVRDSTGKVIQVKLPVDCVVKKILKCHNLFLVRFPKKMYGTIRKWRVPMRYCRNCQMQLRYDTNTQSSCIKPHRHTGTYVEVLALSSFAGILLTFMQGKWTCCLEPTMEAKTKHDWRHPYWHCMRLVLAAKQKNGEDSLFAKVRCCLTNS